MKVAVFDNVPEGGAKRVVYEQIKYLATQGHRVSYFASEVPSSFPFAKIAKVRRYNLVQPKYKGWKRPLAEWWLKSDLPKIYQQIALTIEASGAEAVIVHPCQLTQAPWLLQLIKLPTIYFVEEPLRVVYEPTLHSIQDLPLITRTYTRWQRRLLKKIDQANVSSATFLMANSEFTAKNCKKVYDREALINRLGVDGRIFHPTKQTLPLPQTKILFVGEKHALNGYPLLRKVLKKRPEIGLEVIDFSDKAFRYTDVQLAKLYSQSLVTVCLSRSEPFGLVALESMACGTPVIAINEGGYKETVLDHQTGLLIKPSNKALDQALDVVLQNGRLVRNWGIAAREHVIDHFSWRQHGKRLETALQDLISS